MPNSTTVRISRKTKERLQKVSDLAGLQSLSKTLDFAVEAAEDKLNEYHGNIDTVIKFKAGESKFRNTSRSVDKVLGEALKKKKR